MCTFEDVCVCVCVCVRVLNIVSQTMHPCTRPAPHQPSRPTPTPTVLFCALTSAPAASSTFTIVKEPLLAAWCSAVSPY